MTYEELKKRMIDFGFEEKTYLTDEMALSEFHSSINQARQTISQSIPLIGRYDFVQDGTATGLHRIDLKAETENDPDGDVIPITLDGSFDKIDSMQIIYGGRPFPFSDYTLEQGHIVVLNYALAGSFTIFYEKGVDLINTSTPDNFDIQIDSEAEHLVPLLASYHAWLDDDIQKATMYYNEYEQELNRILQARAERQNKVKARIVGGIRWH